MTEDSIESEDDDTEEEDPEEDLVAETEDAEELVADEEDTEEVPTGEPVVEAEETVADTRERADSPLPIHLRLRVVAPRPQTLFEGYIEDVTPVAPQGVETPPTDPITPPHVPIEGGVPLFAHHWIVQRMSEDLGRAQARLGESRRELAAERAARYRLRRQGGDRVTSTRRLLREITRLELRACLDLRHLQRGGSRRVQRADAEDILVHAMTRVRDLLRRRA